MKNIITALEQGKRDYKAELDRINTNYVKGSYEYNKAQIKAADDYKAYKLSQVDVFKKELIRAQAQADVLKEMYEKVSSIVYFSFVFCNIQTNNILKLSRFILI